MTNFKWVDYSHRLFTRPGIRIANYELIFNDFVLLLCRITNRTLYFRSFCLEIRSSFIYSVVSVCVCVCIHVTRRTNNVNYNYKYYMKTRDFKVIKYFLNKPKNFFQKRLYIFRAYRNTLSHYTFRIYEKERCNCFYVQNDIHYQSLF